MNHHALASPIFLRARRTAHMGIAAAAVLTSWFLPSAEARTIAWGSDVGSIMLDSTGVALNDSYVFELGTFGSFVPDATNTSAWVANWKVFDRAIAPAANGWNSGFGWVASSATVEADQTTSRSDLPQLSFAAGEQAFMLIYNSLSFGTPGVQFALVTDDGADGDNADNWVMPSSDTHNPNTLDFYLNSANKVVFGGVNNQQGAGSHSATPASFTLQTHTTVTPVPEPGSISLLTLGTLTLLRRRRV